MENGQGGGHQYPVDELYCLQCAAPQHDVQVEDDEPMPDLEDANGQIVGKHPLGG